MAGFHLISILKGFLGIIIILAIALLLSENRKNIDWKFIFIGLGIQFLLALGILYVPFIGSIFEWLGKIFIKLVDFTKAGTVFLLGDLMKPDKYGFIFLFQTLPVIIFFSALTSLLYYWGVIQKIVYLIAWPLRKLMVISGAEGLAAAANIFMGLSEVPLLIKAYLPKMTPSELFLVMTAGMSTISAGVMGAYIGLLGGEDPTMRLLFAKHLLAASVMAAPGAIVIAKIILPQTKQFSDRISVPERSSGTNFLEALTKGTAQGVQIFINVAAMLVVFIALIALINYILGGLIGHYTGLNSWVADLTNGQFTEFNLQFILGSIFAPLMWLIGVAKEDMTLVGALLGQKLTLNEFVAFVDLNNLKNAGTFVHQKSIIMSVYLVCGFANFGSIGMQIGAITSLAPDTRKFITKYSIKSMLAGGLVSAMSATLIGMIMI